MSLPEDDYMSSRPLRHSLVSDCVGFLCTSLHHRQLYCMPCFNSTYMYVCDKTFGFPRNSQPGLVLGAAPIAHPIISFLGNEKKTEIQGLLP